MKKEQLIAAFVQLGKLMEQLSVTEEWSGFETGVTKAEFEKLKEIIERQFVYNGWFTKENVLVAISAWGELLQEKNLTDWSGNYSFSNSPKKIAVIMAGNIPLVGFHDFLSVLISGNYVAAKLSSEDQTLLPAFVDCLVKWEPALKERIELTTSRLPAFDAVIATGSNNSMQHFKDYFGKYPHLFRRNRTSVAILDGSETEQEIKDLGKDIFSYYGLGCRNVTHLMIPDSFELKRFFEGVFSFSDVIYHKKYGNNYDYNKAVYLMNKMELLDNNFVLLRESEDLFSPISMIHYHRYSTKEEIDAYLVKHEKDIQAIVGKGYIDFGQAQCPALDVYADNTNTLDWLKELEGI
ncbi:MAG: acyl-CoA reductase [Bacteroidetes bacterium]|nr:acyl-CoA reductase [Bacteroidota bacterium]